MQTLRRLRREGQPLALLGAYVALQAAISGVAALPGGYGFEPQPELIVLQLALVVFVARGSLLAWRLLLAWEVFGVAVMLVAPFALGVYDARVFLGATIIALEVLSLAALWSPSLERYVLVGPNSAPSARRSTA